MEPCSPTSSVAHVVIAVFTGLSTLLGVFLAHRRQRADKERGDFYRAVAERLDLPEWKDAWVRSRSRGGNGR